MNPRISSNHLSKYLATLNPSTRTKIIRDAKYVKQPGGASSYSKARDSIRAFLLKNTRDVSYFDSILLHLQSTYDTASGPKAEGIKAETKRCIRGIEAFKIAFLKKRWTNITFVKPDGTIDMPINGTRVSVDLDARVEHFKGNYLQQGGIITFFATADRKKIDDRRKFAANMIYWATQSKDQSIPAGHNYCFSMDVFGPVTQKASDSTSQFRQKIEDACDEIASRWDSIIPPKNFKS